MSHPAVSPAYQQILDWYQHCQTMATARPIGLLVTSGAPDEGADMVKATSADTQTLDVFA